MNPLLLGQHLLDASKAQTAAVAALRETLDRLARAPEISYAAGQAAGGTGDPRFFPVKTKLFQLPGAGLGPESNLLLWENIGPTTYGIGRVILSDEVAADGLQLVIGRGLVADPTASGDAGVGATQAVLWSRQCVYLLRMTASGGLGATEPRWIDRSFWPGVVLMPPGHNLYTSFVDSRERCVMVDYVEFDAHRG